MSAEADGPGTASFARERRFWTITGWAAVFGVVMGGVGILWLLLVEDLPAELWGHPTEHDFAGGKWWWIPLATGFGLLVGLLRRWLTTAHQPDLFTEIGEEHVDRKVVPASVGVSAVSLIGGASLGPEGGLALEEVDNARARGWAIVGAGPRILRTETAGPAIIAVLQARFGDLGVEG